MGLLCSTAHLLSAEKLRIMLGEDEIGNLCHDADRAMELETEVARLRGLIKHYERGEPAAWKALRQENADLRAKLRNEKLEPIIINRLRVGEFEITAQTHGGFWMGHVGGEAMETSSEKLETLIREFYTREF